MPSSAAKMKILLTLAKNSCKREINFSRSALFQMKIRISLKYFVNDCIWKHFFATNFSQTPTNIYFLTKIL